MFTCRTRLPEGHAIPWHKSTFVQYMGSERCDLSSPIINVYTFPLDGDETAHIKIVLPQLRWVTEKVKWNRICKLYICPMHTWRIVVQMPIAICFYVFDFSETAINSYGLLWRLMWLKRSCSLHICVVLRYMLAAVACMCSAYIVGPYFHRHIMLECNLTCIS